jgi:hypothetical protein
MKKNPEPEFDGELDNEYDYAAGYEKRQRRWNDQDRKLRKERRHPQENDLYGN